LVASRRPPPGRAAHRCPTWDAARRLCRHRRRRPTFPMGHAGGRGGEERSQGLSRARGRAVPAGAAALARGARVTAGLAFHVSLAVIVWVYVGYPVVLGLVAALRRRPIDRRPVRPEVSLIICAYNEERDIRRKLEETLACDYPMDRLEVIVASD